MTFTINLKYAPPTSILLTLTLMQKMKTTMSPVTTLFFTPSLSNQLLPYVTTRSLPIKSYRSRRPPGSLIKPVTSSENRELASPKRLETVLTFPRRFYQPIRTRGLGWIQTHHYLFTFWNMFIISRPLICTTRPANFSPVNALQSHWSE